MNPLLTFLFCLQVRFPPHSLVATPLLVRCQPWAMPTLLTSDPNIHYRELQQDQVLCRLPSQVSLPWLPTLPPSRPLLMLLMLLLLLLLLCVAQCDTNPARWVWLSLVVRSSHCSSRMPNLIHGGGLLIELNIGSSLNIQLKWLYQSYIMYIFTWHQIFVIRDK